MNDEQYKDWRKSTLLQMIQQEIMDHEGATWDRFNNKEVDARVLVEQTFPPQAIRLISQAITKWEQKYEQ